MKKLLILTVILAFVAMSASAQVSKPFNIYAGGGLNMPMSPDMFKDFWKSGFHGYGAVGYNSSPSLQILGKVEFQNFPLDWDAFGVTDVEGASLRALMFGAAVKMGFGLPDAPVKPTLMGGLGMANVSFSDISDADSSVPIGVDETKVYFEFGGGADFKIGPTMCLFVMARYVSVATSGEATSFVPFTVGLKF